jgi:hypothetical protein
MLISAAEMSNLSGLFGEVFDSFSYNRTITVHKEPLKTLSNSFTEPDAVFGFGENQKSPVYDYTPVSQTFSAIIRYKHNINDSIKTELDIFYSKGGVSVQVKKDCYDYIQKDKTEKITFDDRSWFLFGEPRAKKFLKNEYYILYLQNFK